MWGQSLHRSGGVKALPSVSGMRTKSWTEYIQKGDMRMYSDEQCRKALKVYKETKWVTKTHNDISLSSTPADAV